MACLSLPGWGKTGGGCRTGVAPPWSWFIDGAGAFLDPLRVRLSRFISTPLLAQVPFDWNKNQGAAHCWSIHEIIK